ncbi:KdsC family phosphatase [Sporolituus thermophilus]|uniref:3-deoxy-D-manno-octulosonate 8-phosphate phosphatase (KDO 8-P phosphatase) n=1 Tax=Sporolituus thermophilus DSM 23256 TaxID=1123285 RepID=A0A1G7NEQ0_9FIRM|nr:HAD hydrolase family protein [Sporolituus thermophilus]SDF72387.1 3-deoxy-D-manno-octulosonate 8-phosphate phosphatase (KDO 8-P phosphatase) [Sporolituus thermophilus DSM 23256]
MDRETRAQKVKLLVFDVDGVLTNGQIIFGPDGEAMKVFHAQDGLGISVAHKVGLKTAIITGRETEMVRRRGAELNITDVYQGAMDKVAALNELLAKHGLAADEVGYVGDDLNDLPVMLRVGLACAVANAAAEVKAAAHFVATREGGRGAVREIIEFILKAQGKWERIVLAYRQPGHIETKQ